MRESRKQKVGSLKALIKLTNPCQDQEKWQKRKSYKGHQLQCLQTLKCKWILLYADKFEVINSP